MIIRFAAFHLKPTFPVAPILDDATIDDVILTARCRWHRVDGRVVQDGPLIRKVGFQVKRRKPDQIMGAAVNFRCTRMIGVELGQARAVQV